jgi:hypothetical protein
MQYVRRGFILASAVLALAPISRSQCAVPLRAATTTTTDVFAIDIATEGEWLAVGDHLHTGVLGPGAVTMFRRLPITGWAEVQTLDPGDSIANYFGYSVALSGDCLAVGCYGDDLAAVEAGSVFVFRLQGSTWVQEARLVASDAQFGDLLGWRVAIDGDVIAATASGDDTSDLDAGAVYVFERIGGFWQQTGKLTDGDSRYDEGFGSSLALEGRTLVLGAPQHDGGAEDAGAVYIYRGGPIEWSQQSVLQAADLQAGDRFGASVSLSGRRIAVGASLDDDSAINGGEVYLFQRLGGVWVEEVVLQAQMPGSNDHFGFAVALEDRHLVVGAQGADGNGSASGVAYRFQEMTTTGWQQIGLIAGESNEDRLGYCVDLSAGKAVLGAPEFIHGSGYALSWDLVAADANPYGVGVPGTLGLPTVIYEGDALPGLDVRVRLTNSAGVDAFCTLLAGQDPANVPFGNGGTVLVRPTFTLPLLLPPTGSGAALGFLDGCIEAGTSWYFQLLQADAGASGGFALSEGLEAHIGWSLP